MIPSGALGDSTTRVLLAVQSGRRTYGELMAATGLSRSVLFRHLDRLRALRLVTWERGQHGTTRSLVQMFPPGKIGQNRSGPGDCANSPRSVARPTEEV